MQYFLNVVSFWGALSQTPTGALPLEPLGDFRPSDPLIAHTWKKNPGGANGQGEMPIGSVQGGMSESQIYRFLTDRQCHVAWEWRYRAQSLAAEATSSTSTLVVAGPWSWLVAEPDGNLPPPDIASVDQ